MLDEKERRFAERRLAEEGRDGLVRAGMDWAMIALGLALCGIALRKQGYSDGLAAAIAGGFIVGSGFARAFLARQGRVVAKLYREVKAREGSA
jgi:hypothetical protein